MSRTVNDQHDLTSPSSRSRHTSTPPLENSPRGTHAGDPTPSNQNRLEARSTSTTTSEATQNRRYPLHEFHSLLEAAQRIETGASLDTEGDRWREDDQPEPIIHLYRRRLGDSSQRRLQSRTYSGRPHVPGEDSGSEEEERANGEDEMNPDLNARHERRDRNNPWLNPDAMQRVLDGTMDMDSPHHAGSDGASGTRSDHGRTRNRQQEEEEERDLLEQALARSRAARSRFEADNQRTNPSDGRETRYSTTGSFPTSQSFYDWAPEPSDSTDPSPSIFRSRSRAASIRRWRPAERLQDYASNHARRDSGNAAPLPIQGPNSQSGAGWIHPVLPVPVPTQLPSQTPDANSGSHDDVVDRVERALQQYRIARRALRPQNEDITFEALPSSDAPRSVFSRALRDRSAATRPAPADGLGVAQDMPAYSGFINDAGPPGRVDLSTAGPRDPTATSAALRPNVAGTQRREDPLRQRIREQIRERRRRSVQQALEREPPFARGPLFDGTAAPQHTVSSDARRLIEQVRQANMREHSTEFRRARGALEYLAQLRDHDMTEVKAWTLAAGLGLHNKGLEDDSYTNLPWSVDSLPKYAFSSWLEPGTTWTGIQDANDPGERPTLPHGIYGTPSPALSQRDRELRESDTNIRRHETFRPRMEIARDPLTRTLLGDRASDPIGVARHSIQVLEDAERSLSLMLERSEEMLRENDRQLQQSDEQLRQSREELSANDQRLSMLDEAVRRRAEVRARRLAIDSDTSQPAQSIDSDWWNVKVTLHSIDEKQMTVSGTMTASHKLNRPAHSIVNSADSPTEKEESVDTSMDSFFTGEIVDFVHHGLDTLPSLNEYRGPNSTTNAHYRRQQDEWKVGGPATDLNYWAGIGPFKEEINRAIKVKKMQNDLIRAMQIDEEHLDKHSVTGNNSTTMDHESDMDVDSADKYRSALDPPDSPLSVPLTEEEKYAVKMEVMADLLSNTKWLNENIGAQGWILMRWKERCFVSPGTDPNPDVRRPWISGQPREPSQSIPAVPGSDEPGSAIRNWNVNDLIAHDRLRRRREQNARVWSTNAAEREELATASTSRPGGTGAGPGESSARNSAWGLTISGFYYVALERRTGRIEALYFDCGSTPFQKLKMSPQVVWRGVRSAGVGLRGREREEDGTVATGVDVDVGAFGGGRGEFERVDLSGITGLKSSFSIVEFR